ncbi:MAG TPA: hypothetical protein VE420_17210, partial [Gemmatimonadales bacterium]|nr:hypothetical protein [Gemmatimonadales bacterium]
MMFVPKVDLSGEWVQIDAVYSGTGPGGSDRPALGGPDGRTRISLIAGVPVNCGPTCAIVQDGRTVTITRPPTKAPDTGQVGSQTFMTDGSESVVQEGNSRLKATAKWEGDKLVVYRMITSNLHVTQKLFMKDGKLHVESTFSSQDAPVVLIYEKR